MDPAHAPKKQHCNVTQLVPLFTKRALPTWYPHFLPTLPPGFEFGGKRLEDLEA